MGALSKREFNLYSTVSKVICIFFFHTGGYRFFSDLLNKINLLNTSTLTGKSGEPGESVQVSIEFIRVKSYQDDRYFLIVVLFWIMHPTE